MMQVGSCIWNADYGYRWMTLKALFQPYNADFQPSLTVFVCIGTSIIHSPNPVRLYILIDLLVGMWNL
jgi:hypothetical protein